MIGLTHQQAKCLRYLEDYIRAHGIPPSLREICAAVGQKSQSGAVRLLDGLEERGRIRRVHYRPRSLEIVDRPQDKIIGFLPPDVRNFVTDYAKAHHVLPETVIAERMREWAEHEKRGAA